MNVLFPPELSINFIEEFCNNRIVAHESLKRYVVVNSESNSVIMIKVGLNVNVTKTPFPLTLRFPEAYLIEPLESISDFNTRPWFADNASVVDEDTKLSITSGTSGIFGISGISDILANSVTLSKPIKTLLLCASKIPLERLYSHICSSSTFI